MKRARYPILSVKLVYPESVMTQSPSVHSARFASIYSSQQKQCMRLDAMFGNLFGTRLHA